MRAVFTPFKVGERIVVTCFFTYKGDVLKGASICMPDDPFSKSTGQRKALARAIEPLKLSRKKRKKVYGKVFDG